MRDEKNDTVNGSSNSSFNLYLLAGFEGIETWLSHLWRTGRLKNCLGF